jgi:membrane-associated phospholipid phosphatase
VRRIGIVLALFTLAPALSAQDQPPSARDEPPSTQEPPPPAPEQTPPPPHRGFFGDLVHDEAVMWTSPARIRAKDLAWLLPLGGATAALIATDASTAAKVSNDPSQLHTSRVISYGGEAYSTFGAAGFLFLGGAAFKDDHARHVGQYAIEAGVDAVVVVEVLKLLGRERPLVGDGQGRFFKGGNSFPSGHAILAWSLAGVAAGEYPHPLVKVVAFSYATAISVARFTGRSHFGSDVLVGSSLGYMIGHFVVKEHHPQEHPARPSAHFELTPFVSGRGVGVALNAEF